MENLWKEMRKKGKSKNKTEDAGKCTRIWFSVFFTLFA